MNKYKTDLVKPVYAKNPKFDWQVCNVDVLVSDLISYLQSIEKECAQNSNGWANFQITKSKDPQKVDENGKPKLAFARVSKVVETPVSASSHMPDRVETSDDGSPF